MNLQDVLLKAMAKKITWWEAAEIFGVTDRTMRRWRERLQEEGYSGLVDRSGCRGGDPDGERWKSRGGANRGKPKTGFPPFPPPLGNPKGFPLAHRSDGFPIHLANQDEKTSVGKPTGNPRRN